MKHFYAILCTFAVVMCFTNYSLAADVWDGTTSEAWTKGTGTEADPYLIETTAQWAYLKAQVAAGNTYAGIYFLQTQDIDLNSKSCSIGTSSYPFSGNYDGGGHEIASYYELFSCIQNASIRNLIRTQSGTSSYFEMISVAKGNCRLENCHNNTTIVSCSRTKTTSGITTYCYGGLIAYADTLSMSHCSNRANISVKDYYAAAGGLVGYAEYISLYQCINYGDITFSYSSSSSSDSSKGTLSGLVASYSYAEVIRCGNEGNLNDGSKYGCKYKYGIKGTIVKESYNKGTISTAQTSSTYTYGIYGTKEISNCYVLGGPYINSAYNAYVFISSVFSSPNLKNCYYAANSGTQVCMSTGNNVYSNILSYETYTSSTHDYVNLNNIKLSDTLMKSTEFPNMLNDGGEYFCFDYMHQNDGYPILKWQLGDTEFYTINAFCQESQGSINGAGSYPNGAQIQLTATPKEHYTFTRWSDGVTDNPRTIPITADATYVAQFERSSYTVYINQDCSITVE